MTTSTTGSVKWTLIKFPFVCLILSLARLFFRSFIPLYSATTTVSLTEDWPLCFTFILHILFNLLSTRLISHRNSLNYALDRPLSTKLVSTKLSFLSFFADGNDWPGRSVMFGAKAGWSCYSNKCLVLISAAVSIVLISLFGQHNLLRRIFWFLLNHSNHHQCGIRCIGRILYHDLKIIITTATGRREEILELISTINSVRLRVRSLSLPTTLKWASSDSIKKHPNLKWSAGPSSQYVIQPDRRIDEHRHSNYIVDQFFIEFHHWNPSLTARQMAPTWYQHTVIIHTRKN